MTLDKRFSVCVLMTLESNNSTGMIQTPLPWILGADYKYTVDWTGCNFCGLKFEWNYKDGYADVAMPGHIKDILMKFKHVPI